MNDADGIYTTIGKFCSIAAHTRINPGNHPMMPGEPIAFQPHRSSAYFDDAEDDADFFAWRRSTPVTIGHDVWIGHGAIILPGRSIGTGAARRCRRRGRHQGCGALRDRGQPGPSRSSRASHRPGLLRISPE